MELFVDGDPVGLFEKNAHRFPGDDACFDQVVRLDDWIVMADPLDRFL